MTKVKLQPQRMCIACREMKDKKELVRVVKNNEGEIFVDLTGKANGRGAYVCKSKECFAKLKKQKGLNKAFKCPVEQEIYSKIEGELFE